jgi:mono/diheme cytochrome c family protein
MNTRMNTRMKTCPTRASIVACRIGPAAAVAAGLALVLDGFVSAAPPADAAAEAFFSRHCLRCHDADTQEGGFRLDDLARDFGDMTVAERWAEVRSRIAAGEMPPKEEPRPSGAEIAETIDSISRRLDAGQAVRMGRRGPVSLYRLSREEYGHAIYDLLGVHLDTRQPGLLHEDPRWHGFERVGAVLTLAPDHVERYLQAAEVAATLAFPDRPAESRTARLAPPEGQRWLLAPGTRRNVGTLATPGLYRLRIRASGLASFKGRTPRLSLWHAGIKRVLDGADVVAAEAAPVVIDLERLLPAGPIDLLNEAPGTFALQSPGVHNGVPNTIATLAAHRPNPRDAMFLAADGTPLVPLVLVDSVEVEGPIELESDREKRRGLFPADAEPAAVRGCLVRLAERAWRRPVDENEIAPLADLVAREVSAGASLPAAYRTAVVAVLTSHRFCYLREGQSEARRDRVDDLELAARLSFFLWSSIPDERLLADARAGKLHEPDVLVEQVTRMLDDPRIGRFEESFPRQWLQLHRLGMFAPDKSLYPDYDGWLERSMAEECSRYFAVMFRENRPIAEFLDSDWTLLNPRLARHYGLDPPAASGWRRTAVAADGRRGGLLTQAAVLSLTSDGTRHRPVHRGAWLLETLTGRSPPPPPPNIEPLEPKPRDEQKATVRMQLASHASHATCAACHSAIDPLGFAFDNYDALGRWRDRERVDGGRGEDPVVDASGTLPDGRRFAGPAEFKRLLAADDDRFARALVGQFVTYALRRVPTIDDAAMIEAVVDAARAEGYRLRSFVEAFARSPLFQSL